MAATKKHQTPPAVMDPKFEWAEKAGSYVLRVTLPAFRKADLRVQVDGAGRFTIRGTRTGTTGTTSLCKVFQLPSAASHHDIDIRFEAGVLTLTAPKCAFSSATVPTSIAEMKRKLVGVAKPKEEVVSKKGATDKAIVVGAEKEANAEHENKAMAECVRSWRDRAMGELKGLTDTTNM